MSLNDFKNRPRLNITVTFDCSGAFDPFTGFGDMNWSLSGSASGQTGQTNPTVREITCYPPTDPDVAWGFFNIQGSTGSNSGKIDTGVLPERFAARSFASRLEGFWKVNTDPVLSQNGNANNQPASRSIYYVVALPDTPGASVDTPILIDPPIDELRRVYPGDYVAIDQFFGTQRWYVYPQRRLPKPDRTFFWVPNEEPVIASGGIVDGVLAKPGTVMIPTKTVLLEAEDAIDNYRYFHEGVGIMFDGQKWNNFVFADVAHEGEEDESIWPIPVFISDQPDQNRFETDHSTKHIISSNTQQNQSSVSFSITSDNTTQSYPAYFAWSTGIQGNMQPTGVFYDHGDSYSYRYKKQLAWKKENELSLAGAVGGITTAITFGELVSFAVYVNEFVNGNITEWQETGFGWDGEELINNYKVSLQITTTLE